jgi:hypothetical protein
MRKHTKVLLTAEEQLVFGQSLPQMVTARDDLRRVIPDCLLLDLLDAKIARTRISLSPRMSPWAA